MKTHIKHRFFILVIALFPAAGGLGGLVSCSIDDDNKDLKPIEKLPEAAQTGENTIGCLVDGKVFTDSGLMNNFYQYVDGQYYLAINASKDVGLSSENIRIRFRGTVEEGKTYILNKNPLNNQNYNGGSGNYSFTEDYTIGGNEYHTTINSTGEIYFSRFDEEAGIMSGTFYFNAEEITTGEVVEITDGRFDLTFTN